jgi:class II lanthipeptide synthase
MSRYRDQVAAALSAVSIHGPARYAWMGRRSRRLPAALHAELSDAERRSYLVWCLCEELYWSFYCRGRPGPARWGEATPASPEHGLADSITRANTGRGSSEPGWTVERVEGGSAVVSNDRVRARLPVTECLADSGEIRPGVAVRVRLPKQLPALSPGFCVMFGDAPPEPDTSGGMVRVYWNITRAGAPGLVRAVTSRINGRGIPFRLKVADHAFHFQRCDAAVLYLSTAVFRDVEDVLRVIAAEATAALRADIPAFTLPLAPGVGLAEADVRGESFGLQRCEWLADAIVHGHEDGISDLGKRIDVVADRFARESVDLDAPYLEPSLAGRHVL